MKNAKTQKPTRSKELEKSPSKGPRLEELDAPSADVKGGGQINDV